MKGISVCDDLICAIEKQSLIDELTVIMRKLQVTKADKVLDMGCGKGFIHSFLPKFYNEMTGVDIDEKN